MIRYTPERGFQWVESVLGNKYVLAVWESNGDAGIYYLLAFGHPCSAHKIEFDLAERESKVLEEIKFRKVGSGRTKGKFPADYYQTTEYQLGSSNLNRMTCTPGAIRIDELRELEANKWAQISNKIWATDPEKRSKELDADTKGFKLIQDIRKEIRIEETHINKMVSRTGMVTLDELMTD